MLARSHRVKKESPNMGTKTNVSYSHHSILFCEKRIPKHGDENRVPGFRREVSVNNK